MTTNEKVVPIRKKRFPMKAAVALAALVLLAGSGSAAYTIDLGGIQRIVWMPKELKDDVAERLNKTAQELYGIENFTDMVADETVTTDCEELLNWLTEKGHPVLGLEPLM